MGKIDSYEAVNSITGNERFVIETDEGTKKAFLSLIMDKINDCVEDKAEMLSFSDVSVTKDTESEYILDITIGTTHLTTPNLRGKSIKSVGVEAGHLLICFSDDTSIDAGVIDGSVPTYGVRRNINSHSPELERMGDAVGLVAEVGVGSELVRNDFDKIYPWCAMRKCTLADDGTVTSYYGDANYIEDGSIGQVMVEIPKYYYAHYVDEPGVYEYWYISKEKINSKYRLPQPFIAKDGSELDKIYIAAYFFSDFCEENEKADSISGDAYCGGGQKYADGILWAANRGLNWHCMDAAEWCDVIQPLFITEFATLNSQSVMLGASEAGGDNFKAYTSENQCIGDKTDGVNEIVSNYFYTEPNELLTKNLEICIYTDNEYLTGAIDDHISGYAVRNITEVEQIVDSDNSSACLKISFDGDPIKIINPDKANNCQINMYRNGITYRVKASSGSNVGTEGCCDMVYRGLENIYSCVNTFLGGVLFANGGYYITENVNAHSEAVTDMYKKYGDEINIDGFVDKMDSFGVPWLYLPVSGSGTSNTDFCDNSNIKSTATPKSLTVGCSNSYKNIFEHGIFSYYAAVKTRASGNGRLAYRAYE